MENMHINGIAAVDFIFYSTIFVFGMLLFFSRKNLQSGKLYFLWSLISLAVWGNAMISPRPMVTKIFVSLLLLSTVILQTMISRRERLASR
jgi:hypothetical protein